MTAGPPPRIRFDIRVHQQGKCWVERYAIPSDELWDDGLRILDWIRKQIERWNRDYSGSPRSVSAYRVENDTWIELEEPIE